MPNAPLPANGLTTLFAAGAEPVGPPPPEVLESIARAARTIRRLEASSLRLELTCASGRVGARLLDGEGRLLEDLDPSRLLELLDGGGAAVTAGKP